MQKINFLDSVKGSQFKKVEAQEGDEGDGNNEQRTQKRTSEDASEPVSEVVEKKKVVVVEKKKKKAQPVLNISNPKRTIYVGNLSYDANESSIKGGLSSLGNVEKVHVVKNNKGRGAGFAYVTFQDEKTASKAIESSTPISLDGRDIRMKAFDPESLYRRTGKRKAKRKRE